MKKDISAQFLCKDCENYNRCQYYYKRKEDSYICKYFHLPNTLNKILAEITDTGAYEQETQGKTEFLRGITYCLNVIDKYMPESKDAKRPSKYHQNKKEG